jgi:hypothetical protein
MAMTEEMKRTGDLLAPGTELIRAVNAPLQEANREILRLGALYARLRSADDQGGDPALEAEALQRINRLHHFLGERLITALDETAAEVRAMIPLLMAAAPDTPDAGDAT